MNISRSDLKIIRSGKPFSIGTLPSQLMDGRKVMVIAKNKGNGKLGPMIQLCFLDVDVKPSEVKADEPNAQGCSEVQGCGAFHACYVQAFPLHMWALDRAWNDYTSGNMPSINLGTFLAYVASCGTPVRFGEFGDPSSVPFEFLEEIASKSSGWTGYTHGWKHCDQRLRYLCMASVESESDYRLAKSMGWNVFWINGTPDKHEKRMTCLEVSKGIQCADCRLCSGSGRKFDIVIPGHGQRSKKLVIA